LSNRFYRKLILGLTVHSLTLFLDRLSDIAELSELNLKLDVYPMTRLLLYNRKARIVDVIPPGMKVMYTAAPAFKRP
jgi:hypothetical protein